MRRSRVFLVAVLAVAAAARIVLQAASLPPYAGLDEVYHVARLAFVLQEGRQPDSGEPSVPPYLAMSIANDPRAMPAFCVVGPRWPDMVRERAGRIVFDGPLNRDLRPYVSANYEAQQPSLYYRLAAIAARFLPARTTLSELRLWRMLSVLFALTTVMATAIAGSRWFGTGGILASAIVISLPTWLTLVVRASNDAMACALIAAGIAMTSSAPRRLPGIAMEAIVWALAAATKLYTWPVMVVVPFFWRMQRASHTRIMSVSLACGIAIAITIADLSARTWNPLGLYAFDRPSSAATPESFHVVEMIKITIASAIWTSGQHWDALKPLAMLLFIAPLLVLVAVALRRLDARERQLALASAIGLAAFAIAQVVNAAGFIRQAWATGVGLPLGGKEGWYWYSLAPLLVASVIAAAFTRSRTIAWGFIVWLLLWDITIHEVALFHDFDGTASPAHPGALFRWGPLHAPFTAHLQGIGAGPLASHLSALRLIHLAAIFALFGLESLLPERQ